MSEVPARASLRRQTRQMPEPPEESVPTVIQRASRPQERHTEPVRITVIRRRHSFLVYMLWGMVIMGVLLLCLVCIVLPVVGYVSDQWNYGNGRIACIEGRFGHHDQQAPTEVLALESNNQIDVIELPGGDATKARVYHVADVIQQHIGPHMVVTLNVKDVNGDGLLDVVVTAQDGSVTSLILFNNGTSFQTTPPTKGQ